MAEFPTDDVLGVCSKTESYRRECEYLRDLLERLMSEVRPYTRPSMVDYDVFPVFKEAVDYLKGE